MRLDPVNDLNKVKDWINQAYYDVCVETEASVSSTTQTTSANVEFITVSSTIARLKSVYVTPASGARSAPLRQTTLDHILRMRQAGGGVATATGSATHYALLGLTRMELYPTPTTVDTLTIYYVAFPTALSANGDVPILQEPWASKLLEYGALADAADWKGDPSEGEYRQLFEVWKQKFRSHLTRRQGGQPGQFRVFPGSTFPPHDPSTDVGD